MQKETLILSLLSDALTESICQTLGIINSNNAARSAEIIADTVITENPEAGEESLIERGKERARLSLKDSL